MASGTHLSQTNSEGHIRILGRCRSLKHFLAFPCLPFLTLARLLAREQIHLARSCFARLKHVYAIQLTRDIKGIEGWSLIEKREFSTSVLTEQIAILTYTLHYHRPLTPYHPVILFSCDLVREEVNVLGLGCKWISRLHPLCSCRSCLCTYLKA